MHEHDGHAPAFYTTSDGVEEMQTYLVRVSLDVSEILNNLAIGTDMNVSTKYNKASLESSVKNVLASM